MSRKNIDFPTLKIVVDSLGDTFTTKDVSEDRRTKEANQQYRYHSQYHAFVGGALSDHRAELNIIEIQKGTARGSRWQKARSLYGADRSFQKASSQISHSNGVIDELIIDYNKPTISEGNSKEYAVEQINREIYALKTKIENLIKNQSRDYGSYCGLLFLEAIVLIVGISLRISGIINNLIWVFVVFIIVLIIVSFASSNESPEIEALRKRIKALEEKREKIESS